MQVLRPASLKHALAALARDPALRPIAGGTDLLVAWHDHDKRDWRLLDLAGLAGALRPLRLDDDRLELGALTTYWDVLSDARVCAAFPLLRDAARQVGAIQIQTRGTWVGNIANASPAADGVPVLLAYDATVVLQSAAGRRELPLDGYFTGYKQTLRRPDELIVAIRVPRRAYDAAWFHKVGARSAQAITKVGVAVTRGPAGWRVAANSVAPYVCRCRTLEAALAAGQTFATLEALHDVLARDVSPIDDIRSTAEYRATVLARLMFYWLRAQRVAH